MKMMYECLVLILLFTLSLSGQTIDGQYITVINPTTYEVTIAVNMQGAPPGTAGVVSLEYTYNTTDLTFPSSPVKNTDYILFGDFDSYVTQNITRPSANAVRVSLLTTGSPAPVPVATTPINIITLYFTIVNQAGSSNLVWVTKDIAPAFLQPNYTVGTWSNRNDTPLPVELSSFSGKVVGETKVELSWITVTEVSNYGFEIERNISEDEVLWESIGFVEGNGNSNAKHAYDFLDGNPTGGSKFSYRLKQIDIDGKYEYSDIVEVELIPAKYELYQNYPNPFNPRTNIKFSLPEDTKVSIMIYDILGALVDEILNKEYKAGYHKVEFNANIYASGIYIYRLQTKNYSDIKKMVLLK